MYLTAKIRAFLIASFDVLEQDGRMKSSPQPVCMASMEKTWPRVTEVSKR